MSFGELAVLVVVALVVMGPKELPKVLRKLGPDIQWIESYIAEDRMFCVYLATDEDIIRRHAQLSGFPASRIVPMNAALPMRTSGTYNL